MKPALIRFMSEKYQRHGHMFIMRTLLFLKCKICLPLLLTFVLCVVRMVNTCLAEELKEIHAFEQKTLTPEQWEKQKSQ